MILFQPSANGSERAKESAYYVQDPWILLDNEDEDLLEYNWRIMYVGKSVNRRPTVVRDLKGRPPCGEDGRRPGGKVIYLGREIAARMGILVPEHDVDHRNRNPLDNRRQNLRSATRQQNRLNSAKQASPASSQFKGVYHRRSRPRSPWLAQIRAGDHTIQRSFPTEVAAAIAWDEMARRFHGEWAATNEDLGLLRFVSDSDTARACEGPVVNVRDADVAVASDDHLPGSRLRVTFPFDEPSPFDPPDLMEEIELALYERDLGCVA